MQAKSFLVWSWQERFWGCCSEGSHFLELFVCKTSLQQTALWKQHSCFQPEIPLGFVHVQAPHTLTPSHIPLARTHTCVHSDIVTHTWTLMHSPQAHALLHIHPLIYTRIHIHECMTLNSPTHPSYTTQSHTWCIPLQMHSYMHASCVHIHFIYTHMCAHHMLRHVHTLTHSPMYTYHSHTFTP